MTQPILQIFTYDDGAYEHDLPFRTVDIDGEIWFYAVDVCKALGLSNPTMALKPLWADDLNTTDGVDNWGQKQTFNIVSEAGLYRLIFQSRKEGARKFQRWVTKEVLPSIRKTGSYKVGTPDFVKRFNENWDRVDDGYFSVISELYIRFFGRFEQIGYRISDKSPNGKYIRPDISVGMGFPKYLKELGMDDYHKYYKHWTPHGVFDARQYPNSLLQYYIEYVERVWIPQQALDYLKKRDPNALAYLPLLLERGTKPALSDTIKNKRGRPAKQIIPPINDTPDRVAQAIMLPVEDNA